MAIICAISIGRVQLFQIVDSFSLISPPSEVIYRTLDDKDVFSPASLERAELEADGGRGGWWRWMVFYSLARENCPHTFRIELQKKDAKSEAH